MNQILGQNLTVTQVIQLLLAPAVMINACGLLILGINNKYSLVVNRIRLLNEEKRRLSLKAADRQFSYEENVRLESIANQLGRLIFRVRLVRNCVLCYTAGVGLFVCTSLLIALDYYMNSAVIKSIILGTFLLGMMVVFLGVVFSFLETKKGFDIVQFEVKAEE